MIGRLALLALAPALIGVVYLEGQNYDRSIFEFKSSASGAVPARLAPESIGSLKRLGEPRRYDRDTLYEYINGHAEFFLGYQFNSALVAEYASSGASAPGVAIEIFDMSSLLNAFGSVASDSASSAVEFPADRAPFKRMGENIHIFIKGRYRVKLELLDASEPIDLTKLALEYEALFQDESTGQFSIMESLPSEGAIGADFARSDYLGAPELENVFIKRYRVGSDEIELFFMEADSERAENFDREIARRYEGFGVATSRIEIAGAVGRKIEDDYEPWRYLILDGAILGLRGDNQAGEQALERALSHHRGRQKL